VVCDEVHEECDEDSLECEVILEHEKIITCKCLISLERSFEKTSHEGKDLE
jgi:hypothetical protein